MNYNLSNEEYYCEYWRQHFENKFHNVGLIKVPHKNNVLIGHYDFAKKIAYGFPNSHARKKLIHDIFQKESYYPKSISFKKKFLLNDSNHHFINNFFNNSRKVLKNNNGVGSKTVYVVNNIKQCLQKMNNKDYYILQEEIKPLLHNGHKLDERVYLLCIKEDNVYSSYTFKEGHIKLAGFKFNTEKGMGSFATNIKAPKPKKSKGEQFTIDTTDFLDKYISPNRKEKWISQRNHLLEQISKKFLPILVKHTKEYFKNKNEPKYIWHLYGLDILIDENDRQYLCEFNGKPGVIYDAVMPKYITNINRKMCDRIFMEFLLSWMVDSKNRYKNDPTIIKVGELAV